MALLDGWRICPRCGSQLTPGDGVVACDECGFLLYAHSAVTASAIPEDTDGRVLLARRAVEPDRGKWDCIGGFVHESEHPLDGLRREIREETGLAFEPQRFLGIWIGDYDGRATLNLFWTGCIAGKAHPADDVAEIRWFSAEQLPREEELAFRSLLTAVLGAWRQRHA